MFEKKDPKSAVLRYGGHCFSLGNNDVKIDADGEIDSIFGMAYGSFKANNKTQIDLLGEKVAKKNTWRAAYIEFHQLFFEWLASYNLMQILNEE